MIRELEEFVKRLERYPEAERKLVAEAAEWAELQHREQKRASGEPYFIHPLRVAEILLELRMDSIAVTAALLHDVLEDTQISRLELRTRFGKEVESLVFGVTKIADIHAKNKTIQEAETIRKMLFAMVKDIRVILIKLADKLHNMRTLVFLPEEKQIQIATECLDIYAPLAERLGISRIKDELEDLALKHINAEAYEQIRRFVAAKKSERAGYLKRVEKAIYTAAAEEGVKIRVEARAKHFYSVYLKMKRKGKTLDEIYDLLGIRILCDEQSECYTILGIVHKLWPPIEGRFKDYIAMPKANRYQSLHTTLMCYEGRLLEIQIRTHEMHQTAEDGIAAHWLYKKGGSGQAAQAENLPIIKRIKNWDGIRSNASSFLEDIKKEILKESIYVFTPRGDVFEVSKGSTAIDFAYHIHSEVGDHCVGAKADGSIIPLNQELKNTQVIEILTSPKAHPHMNWLRYARSSRARSKIRHWLNQHDETLLAEQNAAKKKAEATKAPPPEAPVAGKPAEIAGGRLFDPNRISITIGNIRNMMIRLAQCCNPSTGDDIIGYVSRGRGIIVHRTDCPDLKNIREYEERRVEVLWGTVSPTVIRFRLQARPTADLFSEIESAIKKVRGHLIDGKLDKDIRGNLGGAFTVELEKEGDDAKILKSLRAIPAVKSITTIAAAVKK